MSSDCRMTTTIAGIAGDPVRLLSLSRSRCTGPKTLLAPCHQCPGFQVNQRGFSMQLHGRMFYGFVALMVSQNQLLFCSFTRSTKIKPGSA